MGMLSQLMESHNQQIPDTFMKKQWIYLLTQRVCSVCMQCGMTVQVTVTSVQLCVRHNIAGSQMIQSPKQTYYTEICSRTSLWTLIQTRRSLATPVLGTKYVGNRFSEIAILHGQATIESPQTEPLLDASKSVITLHTEESLLPQKSKNAKSVLKWAKNMFCDVEHDHSMLYPGDLSMLLVC